MRDGVRCRSYSFREIICRRSNRQETACLVNAAIRTLKTFGCQSFAAQQKNYVEEHEHRHNYLQSEHAALIELSDHEFVKLPGRL